MAEDSDTQYAESAGLSIAYRAVGTARWQVWSASA